MEYRTYCLTDYQFKGEAWIAVPYEKHDEYYKIVNWNLSGEQSHGFWLDNTYIHIVRYGMSIDRSVGLRVRDRSRVAVGGLCYLLAQYKGKQPSITKLDSGWVEVY